MEETEDAKRTREALRRLEGRVLKKDFLTLWLESVLRRRLEFLWRQQGKQARQELRAESVQA